MPDEAVIEQAARNDEAVQVAMRRAVWRLHSLAGMVVAPFLILLALTGAIYLYDEEIDAAWNGSIARVAAPGLPALPLAQQQAAVLAAFPGGEVKAIRLPRHGEEAARWTVSGLAGGDRLVFVDPGRASVTGSADPAGQPSRLAADLHGTLLAGERGSLLVEFMACATIAMLATGIWLWWPRGWRWAGVAGWRLGSGRAARWRDLHAVTAAWVSLLALGLVLTGLPWSAFWGVQFARLGSVVPWVAPSPNFGAHLPHPEAPAPADDMAHADMPGSAAGAAAGERDGLPWSIAHSPMPRASGGRAAGLAAVEAALPRLDADRHGPGIRIFAPEGSHDPYMISYVPDRAEGQRTLHVDPGSGAVIADVGWEDYSPGARIVEWGVMTHMGRQFGEPNRLANLALCLALILSATAGLVLWWRGRGRGRGAAGPLPRGIVAMLGLMGLLFPLLGGALLLLAAWDHRARLRLGGPLAARTADGGA